MRFIAVKRFVIVKWAWKNFEVPPCLITFVRRAWKDFERECEPTLSWNWSLERVKLWNWKATVYFLNSILKQNYIQANFLLNLWTAFPLCDLWSSTTATWAMANAAFIGISRYLRIFLYLSSIKLNSWARKFVYGKLFFFNFLWLYLYLTR